MVQMFLAVLTDELLAYALLTDLTAIDLQPNSNSCFKLFGFRFLLVVFDFLSF